MGVSKGTTEAFHKSNVLIGAHAILLGKERPEPILKSDLIGCRQGGGQTLRAEDRGQMY